MSSKKKLFSLFLSVLSVSVLAGNLRIADVFSDHMVLQCDKPVPVWGWADPGTKVTVEFKGQKYTGTTTQYGEWLVKFTPFKADSKPATMVFSSPGEKKEIKDILVGEVWLCSGQSNMEWPVRASAQGEKMIADSQQNTQIRLLKIARRTSGVPLNDFDAKWQLCSPDSVSGFSAVGYYFGLELFKSLKLPIGLIESAWGGTRIEPWTPPIGFMATPQTKGYLREIATANHKFQEQMKKCLPYADAWLKKAKRDAELGRNIEPLKPAYPVHSLNSNGKPTGLFNAMIAPIVKFPIRGAIWYQGEANRIDGVSYFYKMKALISGWRKLWQSGDFPFYFVQIAPFKYREKNVLQGLWAGQYRAADEIINCDLVFPGDVGNIKNIHPQRKYPVGKRLAMLALVNDYGKKIDGFKSPAFKNIEQQGNKLVISFKNLAGKLVTNDGKPPREFMIAGEDRKYYKAEAEIKGNKIILSSAKVAVPAYVHYSWHNLAEPNLVSDQGLPVLPFNSDARDNLALGKSYISSDKNPWGWDPGLTDGFWGNSSTNCFATGNSDKFPKYVTVDLVNEQELNSIQLGVPPFGSTKTVNIQLSKDGKTFNTVGSVMFKQRKSEKKTVRFNKAEARYIRLEFPNNYPKKAGYNPNFMFITELEAYGK
jgi:sialate O-acetylesterase